jgi:DNA-binding PadR family transcriptional regulator
MNVNPFRSQLDLLLLAIVARRPNHGYAIIEALREQSAGTFDLPEGTIYPALHRLEEAQLLSSSWSDSGGRRSRVYAITNGGREALAKRKDEWTKFEVGVRAVLEGAS